MIRRTTRLLRVIRGRSSHELGTRLVQRLAARAERAGLGRALDLTSPTLTRALRAGTTRDPAELLASFRAGESRPRFFPGPADPVGTAAAVRQRCPGHACETTARADRILAGRFDLLGYVGLDFGAPIDWQRDPVAGRSAPLIPWSRVPYLDPTVVGDHKVVWELNRQQYLVTLGQAYAYSGDERYAAGFARHLEEWMDNNPPKLGINWASSLEVSFRAMSWVWALHLFRHSPALTADLYTRILGTLHVHGRHLERYLSTYFSPNTHLTGEALGLFHLGLFFPELRGAARWQSAGLSVLEEQLERQVRPDGVYFEQASHYHRYTTEFYLHLVVLCEANGIALPVAVRERLGALMEHLLHLARPDGTIPLLGDDDGGRLVQLDGRPPADVRALLACGAAVLSHAGLAWPAAGEVAPMIWLLGAAALEKFDRITPAPPQENARAFGASGFYTMRGSWSPDADWAVIDCGPHGALTGGHAHADALAMEVAVNGRAVLIDSGTYTYPGHERDAFRVTAAHNAVTVDGASSSEPGQPFRWRRTANCTTERWVAAPRFAAFGGHHDGFLALAAPVRCRREVLALHEDYWVVRDVLEGEAEYEAAVHWHTAPDLAVRFPAASSNKAIQQGAELVDSFGSPLLHMVVPDASEGALSIERGWVSPIYGRREPSTGLVYRQRGSGKQDIATFLLPARWARRSPVVRRVEDVEGGCGWEITHSGGTDWLMVSDEGPTVRDDVCADASWLWLRRTPNGEVLEYVALDVRSVQVSGRTLVLESARRPWCAGRPATAR